MNKDTIQKDHISVKPGEKRAVCRCFRSKKMPFCDGSHHDYNKEKNLCVGPVIINGIEDNEV
jgi:CDGSH-type Zn-finger protein